LEIEKTPTRTASGRLLILLLDLALFSTDKGGGPRAFNVFSCCQPLLVELGGHRPTDQISLPRPAL
jgi:hypothetical protein